MSIDDKPHSRGPSTARVDKNIENIRACYSRLDRQIKHFGTFKKNAQQRS